jgi:glycosyltransferase involved in cell wall biosynthesis
MKKSCPNIGLSTASPFAGSIGTDDKRPQVNLTLPVFNEEAQLAESIHTLVHGLLPLCAFTVEIVIVDNGSTDRTPQILAELKAKYPMVRSLRLLDKGRGAALKHAWFSSGARVLSYMDIDLSTDLQAYPLLVQPLLDGQYDVAAGSRLLPGSATTRGLRRELISQAYNLLLRGGFGVRFSDAQCGFKALTAEAAATLVPKVENNNWFFDTELLILAQHAGCRMLDLPVVWKDDPTSTVKIFKTAMEDLRGLWRLRGYRRSHWAMDSGRREMWENQGVAAAKRKGMKRATHA